MVKVDDSVIDGIFKISQTIWEKHGWLSSPNKVELAVYLEATMLYMNEHKKCMTEHKKIFRR